MAYATLLIYIALLFIRPMEWVPLLQGFNPLDYLMALILVTWLASILNSGWQLREAPQNILMLGFFGAVLASHILQPEPYLGTFSGQDGLIGAFTVFGKVVLLYFLVASLPTSTRRIRLILLVIAVGIVFMSFHAILQLHHGYGFGTGEMSEPKYDEGLPRARAFGFFNDPNDLALIFVASMPFFFRAIIRKDGSAPRRLLAAACLIPVSYALVLTQSRGGWLAFAMMCAAFVVVNIRSRFGRKVAIGIAAALFVGIVSLAPGRMGALSSTDASSRGRWAAWGDGMKMLKMNPIAGVGKGRFAEFSDDSRVAHNSFVHCYAELGLLGYFFWLALIYACVQDGLAMARSEPPDEEGKQITDLARAAVPALTGYLAAGFFLSRTYVHPLYIIFGLFAALRTIASRSSEPIPGVFTLSRCKRVLALELASIVGIYLLTRSLW